MSFVFHIFRNVNFYRITRLTMFIAIMVLPVLPVTGQNMGSPDSFWKNYAASVAYELKLDPLSTSDNEFHIRFWTPGQVVDIWADSSSAIRGLITCYAREYDESNLGKQKFFSSGFTLEPVPASKIQELYLNSGISTIPTDDSISGWNFGLNGIIYLIESLESGQYWFKAYLSPELQASIPDAGRIQTFVKEIYRQLKLKKVFRDFSKTIPFVCFTKGTRAVTCKK